MDCVYLCNSKILPMLPSRPDQECVAEKQQKKSLTHRTTKQLFVLILTCALDSGKRVMGGAWDGGRFISFLFMCYVVLYYYYRHRHHQWHRKSLLLLLIIWCGGRCCAAASERQMCVKCDRDRDFRLQAIEMGPDIRNRG